MSNSNKKTSEPKQYDITPFKHKPTTMFGLCLGLTRCHTLWDRPRLMTEEERSNVRKKTTTKPVYRSFFCHRLFDRNMLGLIKQFTGKPSTRITIITSVMEPCAIEYNMNSGYKTKRHVLEGGEDVSYHMLLSENKIAVTYIHNSALHISWCGERKAERIPFDSDFQCTSVTSDSSGNIYMMIHIAFCMYKLMIYSSTREECRSIIFNFPEIKEISRIYYHTINDHLLISDAVPRAILVVSLKTGEVINKLLEGFFVNAGKHWFINKNRIAIDKHGRCFVLALFDDRLYVFDKNYNQIGLIDLNGETYSSMGSPDSISVDRTGTLLLIHNFVGNILVFDISDPDRNQICTFLQLIETNKRSIRDMICY